MLLCLSYLRIRHSEGAMQNILHSWLCNAYLRVKTSRRLIADYCGSSKMKFRWRWKLKTFLISRAFAIGINMLCSLLSVSLCISLAPWPPRLLMWPLGTYSKDTYAAWIDDENVRPLWYSLDSLRHEHEIGPVSYTHLTLPTIYSV